MYIVYLPNVCASQFFARKLAQSLLHRDARATNIATRICWNKLVSNVYPSVLCSMAEDAADVTTSTSITSIWNTRVHTLYSTSSAI